MTNYDEARAAYWRAQEGFRRAAIKELRRTMAEDGIETLMLSINDTPRLTVDDLLDAEGASLMASGELDDVWSVLDSIASDLEVTDWDEAESFLESNSDGSFVVRCRRV